VQQQIDSYKHGQYAQTVQLGAQILQSDSKNAKVRYYMANAFVKLNRIQEAMDQYAACEQITTDPSMKAFCHKALMQFPQALPPPTQPGAAPSRAVNPSPKQNTNQAADQAKAAIWRQADQEIAFKKGLADREIADINQRANRRVSRIPTQILSVSGYEMIPNPEYPELSKQIMDQANFEIQKIQDRFAKEKADIKSNYGKKAAGWDDTQSGISSQQPH
jgi:hypothetical protein